jgi:CBS domain-containing protein
MAEAGIRHLAVKERGVTTGVVSIRDVLGILLDQGIPARGA